MPEMGLMKQEVSDGKPKTNILLCSIILVYLHTGERVNIWKMMVYNCHYFIIESVYSYIYVCVVKKQSDVSILKSEFVPLYSKNNS